MKSYIFAKFATRSLEVLMVAYLDEETNCECRFEIVVRSISQDKVLSVEDYISADDARRAFIYKSLYFWF